MTASLALRQIGRPSRRFQSNCHQMGRRKPGDPSASPIESAFPPPAKTDTPPADTFPGYWRSCRAATWQSPRRCCGRVRWGFRRGQGNKVDSGGRGNSRESHTLIPQLSRKIGDQSHKRNHTVRYTELASAKFQGLWDD